MSLRLKIIILIVGALFVPIFVFVISFKLGTDVESIRGFKDKIAVYREWRDELRDGIVDPVDLAAIIKRSSDPVEVRILDGNGTVLATYSSGLLFEEDLRFHIVETIPVKFPDGEAGFLAVTRPPGPMNHNADRWYVPLTGLVFIAVMVIVISQSLNRSISNLEKATRRIAEGDLDFELPIKGNDKLASLTRSFDSMRAHLKEEYARRSRFIMGISHDLKTPLSSISGYASAIGEGYADSPEKLEKYLAIIEDKTKLLESRISTLIDYVKRETSEWKLQLRDVELEPFFLELARIFESEAVLSDRRFVADLQIPAGLWVSMDEDMLLRGMENLMHNALTYSQEGGSIRLSGKAAAGGGVTISLSNNGPGIPEDVLPHIFDPFVRGSRDRSGAGFGLGLSTVESILSSHGWSIAAESIPEVETVFTIDIPCKKRSEAGP